MVASLLVPAGAARATACGPGMLTYAVHAPGSSTPSPGIRCVRVTQTDGIRGTFVWYGEGDWGGGPYRHVGVGYSDGFGLGSAADIFGNGEAFGGVQRDSLDIFSTGGWPRPSTIFVRRGWEEDWRLVDSVAWTLLPRPLTCGPNFDTWVVENTPGTKGGGIRCFLRDADWVAWFGVGDWDGRTYAHVGWTGYADYRGEGAVDLCDPAFGEACSEFPSGSLQFSPVGDWPWPLFRVGGAWDEAWVHASVADHGASSDAPFCAAVAGGAAGCTSGALLRGRGPLGPEPNAPNTIDGCADGTGGSYHADESIDGLTVSTLDGTPLAAGKTVRFDARVWAYSDYTSDYVDFYYAANPQSPSWTYVGTVQPVAPGESTVSALYVLSPGTIIQAVRAQLRWGGAPGPCAPGAYNDRDDLIFQVEP